MNSEEQKKLAEAFVRITESCRKVAPSWGKTSGAKNHFFYKGLSLCGVAWAYEVIQVENDDPGNCKVCAKAKKRADLKLLDA
jgi:hypothetical protein